MASAFRLLVILLTVLTIYLFPKDVLAEWNNDLIPPTTTTSITCSTGNTYYNGSLACFGGIVTISTACDDGLVGTGCKLTQYTVDGGGGFSPVSSLGTHIVSVWSTDNASNSETPSTYSFTIYPVLSVSCSASPNPVYTNNVATWTANPSGGTGSYSYQWSITDGWGGYAQQINTQFGSDGQKTGTVTVTSGGQRKSATCSLTVTSLPANPPQPFSFTSITPSCSNSAVWVNINWQRSANATRYVIYSYNQDTGITNYLGTVYDPTTSLTYSEFQSSRMQYFIYAYNDNGAYAPAVTGWSNTVSTPLCPPPPGPFSITSISSSCNAGTPKVDLSWSTSTDANIYYIVRFNYSTGAWEFVTTAPFGTNSYSDNGPLLETTGYQYIMYAYNNNGGISSGWSNFFSTPDCSAPPSAFNLSTQYSCFAGSPYTTLSWTKSYNAAGYYVYRHNVTDNTYQGPLTQYPFNNFDNYTFNDYPVLPNTSYQYAVVAYSNRFQPPAVAGYTTPSTSPGCTTNASGLIFIDNNRNGSWDGDRIDTRYSDQNNKVNVILYTGSLATNWQLVVNPAFNDINGVYTLLNVPFSTPFATYTIGLNLTLPMLQAGYTVPQNNRTIHIPYQATDNADIAILPPLHTITAQAFLDSNRDGIQQTDEPWWTDVNNPLQIILFAADGTTILQVGTIAGVVPGNYQYSFAVPDGTYKLGMNFTPGMLSSGYGLPNNNRTITVNGANQISQFAIQPPIIPTLTPTPTPTPISPAVSPYIQTSGGDVHSNQDIKGKQP